MEQSHVVVGLHEGGVQAEVLDHLTRLPRIRVLDATSDARTLERRIRESRPDAAVVSPEVLRATRDLDGASLLVVADRETTEALRSALGAGAKGFFLWPEERDALTRAVESAAKRARPASVANGRVIGVFGARGGSGVTFLATNLVAACSARGASCVVADLDPFHSDVAVALGVPPNGETRTLEDLDGVLDELTVDHLDRVLYSHPRGFRALLSPNAPGSLTLGPREIAALVRALRAVAEVTVLHLPRSLDEATIAALEASDEVLLVVTLDVLAFRDARRVLQRLHQLGIDGRCKLVVNRATRSEVSPDDAEHVFGLRPVSVIRADRSVERAQNRGEVIAGRSGPAARRVAALAERLMQGVEPGEERP